MTQFTQTSTLETNRRKIPKPRKGDFNYYATKKGILKVKGYNFGEKDVVLDRELEGFNAINPYGITEETTVLEAVELLSNPAAIDVSDLTDNDQLLVDCILVTYEDIQQLVLDNELIRGQKYAIFDYVPSWNIFDGGTMNIEEEQVGIGEILIVTATSPNTLNKVAMSVDYPQDIIYYSLDLIDDRDIGFGDGVDTPIAHFKGMIYYRKDTIQNVECHYDFRNIKFRRWAVDAVAYDNGTAYVAKDVCKSGVDGKIYKCIADTTGEGDPTVNTADWILWLDITADAFVSWTADKNYFNIGDITPNNLIINNTTAGVDYDDFYTFGDYYNWVKNVSITKLNFDYLYEDYNYSTYLNNIVFKTSNETETLYGTNIMGNAYICTLYDLKKVNINSNQFAKNVIVNDLMNVNITDTFSENMIINAIFNTQVLFFTTSLVINNSILSESYSKTIYYDKTDGVKLSYMDGGNIIITDVTA